MADMPPNPQDSIIPTSIMQSLFMLKSIPFDKLPKDGRIAAIYVEANMPILAQT
jgi:hypothetical protein